MNYCPHYPNCNACFNFDLNYEKTIKIKLENFKNLCYEKNIFPENFNNIKIIPSPKPLNYRTRCQVHINDGLIGYHIRKTNQIVNITDCALLDNKINAHLKNLKYPKNFKAKLELILENNKIYEILVEKKYDNQFNQVNPYVNKILKEKLINYLDLSKYDKVLELYSGNGNFTFEIAKKSFVTGIDINVPGKSYKNIKFIKTNINNKMDKYIFLKEDFNKLVLDPPRSGITFTNFDMIFNNKFEKIIYISCNQKTLVNDINKIEKYGYSWKESILLDMFPYTEHIESINVIEFLKGFKSYSFKVI